MALAGFIEVEEVVDPVGTPGDERGSLLDGGDQCPLECPLERNLTRNLTLSSERGDLNP